MSIFYTSTANAANSIYQDVLILRNLSNKIARHAQSEIKVLFDPKLLHRIDPKVMKKEPLYRQQFILNFCKNKNQRIQYLWNTCKRTMDQLSKGFYSSLPYTWCSSSLRELSEIKSEIVVKLNRMLVKAYKFGVLDKSFFDVAYMLTDSLDLNELRYLPALYN